MTIHQNYRFSTLSLAVGLALLNLTTAHAGNATLYGTVTVDGTEITETSKPNLVLGEKGSVIKVLVNGSGTQKNAVGVVGGTLTMYGADITLSSLSQGVMAKAEAGFQGSIHSSVNIGDEDTGKITLTSKSDSNLPRGIRAEDSTVNLSAAELSIASESGSTQNAVGVSATQNAIVNVGGRNNRSISISASDQSEKAKSATNAVELINGATVHVGDVGTQSVTITATSLNKASGLHLDSIGTGAKVLKVAGNTVEIAASAKNVAKGVDAGKGSNVIIGSSNAESVSISGIKAGESQEGADEQAYGIFNVNQAQTEVYGKTVNVVAKGAKDTRAIHVANNTEAQDKSATLTIVGDEVCITAESDDPDHSTVGISAFSHGQVHITGNTVVTASDAIVARGSSIVSINADGNHYTQINGNIDFNYDAPTSKTPVDATVVLNLVGPESSWTGNTVVSWHGTPTSVDEYLSVTGMKLGLSKGAVWTPVETRNDSTTVETGEKYTALNLLENNGGVINIAGSTIDVTVEKMTGTGGTVNLAADLTAEEGSRTGRITIDEADANSKIDVKLKDAKMERNLTSDDLTADEAKSLMDAGIEVAESIAVTSTVEEGMYNDGFRIDEEGAATSTGPNSVMQSTLELAAAAPLAINRILMNDVRKRLGDIRTSQGTSGVWARYDGGRLSGSAGLENDFHTIQAGVDTVPGDSSIRFGAALSYTGSEADYRRGNADMDLYGLSAYGLWMGEAGQFVDVVGRLASAKTDMTVDGGKKGSMDNVALSLSGEFGWRFDVSSLFYVEPQVEATYTFVDAERLELSDGSNYEFDDAHSLLGRAGMAFGMKCPNNKGSVHARVSAVHEFLGDLKVTGGNGTNLETDGKDTWVEYGLGVNFNLTPATYFWADVERTSGGVLDEDWRATVGVRHAF